MSGSLTVDLSPWTKETVPGRWSSTVRSSLGETRTDGRGIQDSRRGGVVAVVGEVEDGAREVVELWVRWI